MTEKEERERERERTVDTKHELILDSTRDIKNPKSKHQKGTGLITATSHGRSSFSASGVQPVVSSQWCPARIQPDLPLVYCVSPGIWRICSCIYSVQQQQEAVPVCLLFQPLHPCLWIQIPRTFQTNPVDSPIAAWILDFILG